MTTDLVQAETLAAEIDDLLGIPAGEVSPLDSCPSSVVELLRRIRDTLEKLS